MTLSVCNDLLRIRYDQLNQSAITEMTSTNIINNIIDLHLIAFFLPLYIAKHASTTSQQAPDFSFHFPTIGLVFSLM